MKTKLMMETINYQIDKSVHPCIWMFISLECNKKMSIFNVPKENNHETNYTKKNCSPSNNLSMNRGSFGSVHGTGNLSIK